MRDAGATAQGPRATARARRGGRGGAEGALPVAPRCTPGHPSAGERAPRSSCCCHLHYEQADIMELVLFMTMGIAASRSTDDARELRRLASTDDLTGLNNLRSLSGFSTRREFPQLPPQPKRSSPE